MKRLLYCIYGWLFTLNHWRQQRLTPAGQIFLCATAAAALFGLDTHLNLAHQMFCFLAGVLLISLAFGLFRPPRMDVTRKLPMFASVGTPVTYDLEIYSRRRHRKGLLIVEDLPSKKPPLTAFLQRKRAGKERITNFMRRMGIDRWFRLVSLYRQATTTATALPELPFRGSTRVPITVTPLKRGPLTLNSVSLVRPDPFGLFNARRKISHFGRMMVLPKFYPMAPVLLPGNRLFQPGGVALASSVGDAEEFVSLREYRPGDAVRRIHWKSWAKTGEPIVKEYQEEFFVRQALILDTFQDAGSDVVFEAAVSVAASLVLAMEGRETLLDLMFIGPEAYCFTSGRGLADTDQMLEILASVDVCKDKPFDSLFPLIARRANLLSAAVCVFLDWDDRRQNLISRLRQLGIFLKVIIVVSPDSHVQHLPGPMQDRPEHFHCLDAGGLREGLAAL